MKYELALKLPYLNQRDILKGLLSRRYSQEIGQVKIV